LHLAISLGIGLLSSLALAQTNEKHSDETSGPGGVGVAQYIATLRGRIQRSQLDYLEALRTPQRTVAATDYLDALRQDLRTVVLETVRQGGTEVEIAVKRAAVELRLEQVNSFERALGVPAEAATTRWNVFGTAELKAAQASLRDEYARLLEAASKFPEARAPAPLLGRMAEFRREAGSLGMELTLRGGAEAPRVAEVRTSLSLPEAMRRVEELASESVGNPQLAAERWLRVEIEHRLGWNASDPALRTVQGNIQRGPHRAALVARVHELPSRIDGWPPRQGPSEAGLGPTPPPEGPLPPPSEKSLRALKEGARAELDAARVGDTRGRAEARARVALHENFVRLHTGSLQNGRQLALAAMSDAELGKHIADYRDWEKALVEAKTHTLAANWHGEAELVHARRWIDAGLVEQRARSPPPEVAGLHGPERMAKALDHLPADSLRVAAFRETGPLNLERERLASLRMEIDRPRPVPDTALEQAYRTQEARVLRAEAETVNRAFAQLEKVLSGNVRDARGSIGRVGGVLALDAHEMLRGHGQAIQRLISEMSAKSPVAAEFLKGAAIHPALLRPPPMNAAYQAERLGDIVLRLHAAGGVQALPRAPPITIDVPKDVAQGPLRPRTVVEPGSTGGTASNDFARLYSIQNSDSYGKLIQDIRRAPGGVIIDVVFPQAWRNQLLAVAYDAESGQLRARVGNTWHRVRPTPPPSTMRAAWALTQDGRVAAVDLRAPETETRRALLRTIIAPDVVLLPAEEEPVKRELARLRSVNLHPALVDTAIGSELIQADELIFDALKLGPIFRASDSRYRGIDVADLRRRLTDDLRELGLGMAAANYKSILSVRGPEVELTDSTMSLGFSLLYEVFQIHEDREPVKLKRVSEWFSSQDHALRAVSPQLQQLLAFAAAVAVMRSAREFGAEEALFGLAAEAEEVSTPRFLCRGLVASDCELPTLRSLMK
jgi:hypothetical protein